MIAVTRATSCATASPLSRLAKRFPRFMGQALRKALKPACNSAEAARACARAAASLGQMPLSGCISARYSWADAGIHASGRVINRKFDLDRNYRNTAEILRAARAFSVPPGSGMQGVLALPVEQDTGHPLRA